MPNKAFVARWNERLHTASVEENNYRLKRLFFYRWPKILAMRQSDEVFKKQFKDYLIEKLMKLAIQEQERTDFEAIILWFYNKMKIRTERRTRHVDYYLAVVATLKYSVHKK